MATLQEIRSRIKSVKSTRQITKAMEMVSAAKLRRAQQRVSEARPYADRMNEMLGSLSEGASGDITHPYFDKREVKKRTLVVAASDRGLCGSFNSRLLRAADDWLAQNATSEVELVVVGKRVLDYYKSRPYPIAASYIDWGGALEYEKAKSLVSFLTKRFIDGETDSVNVIYARFVTTAKNIVTNEQYLPIDDPAAVAESDASEESTSGSKSSRKEYIFEPNPERIYASLLPSYALTRMLTALLDSFASEHSARMIAMNTATTAAGDMIDDLTLNYNKARQGQITKELLEIVSGAEALNA
jgi:F-type H+-transporting ATPase subunit gamma